MHDWQRYGLMLVLGPILLLQGKHVRKVTPRLPEPTGERSGFDGTGPRLRVLIAGDSAAAGVGAASQDEALSGQLLNQLSQHFTVEWRLVAVSGLDSNGLIALLENTVATKYDVVVTSIGVNDVTSLMSPSKWLSRQSRLAQVIGSRFEPELLIHSALPPMDRFTALPQPLRWFMGRWATEMNRQLENSVESCSGRVFLRPFKNKEGVPGALASDGFHPGPLAYAVWGEGLSQEIVTRMVRT
jgi:lysophospholipase L1-like esterase